MTPETIRTKMPRVIKIDDDNYRLDLRYKRLDNLRQQFYGGKSRIKYDTRAEALREAEKIEKQLRTMGEDRIANFTLLSENQNLQNYSAKLELHGKSISDACDFFLIHLQNELNRETHLGISELINKWLEYKFSNKSNPIRLPTIKALKTYANQMIIQFGTLKIDELTKLNIEEWLNLGDDVGQQTRHQRLNYIRQFINYCMSNDYLEKDPSIHIDKIIVLKNLPQHYSPENVIELLKYVKNHKKYNSMLPYYCLCAFAGIRPEECSKLTWSNIDLISNHITIHSHSAKTKRERIVKINDTLKQWLVYCKETYSTLIDTTNLKHRISKVHSAMSFKTIQDGLRHTYATMTCSQDNNYNTLAYEMGNSETILKKYYARQVAESIWSKYWSILPSNIDEVKQDATVV